MCSSDLSDLGIYNAPLHVTGLDVFGASVDITVTTSITGFYLIAVLMPGVYTVTAPGPTHAGFVLAPIAFRTASLLTGGDQDLTLDFIYVLPTAVQVSTPTAVVRPGEVRLSWAARLFGQAAPAFHVWRAAGGGAWKRLTATPLGPDAHDGETASYRFEDKIGRAHV